jgi:chromosomal replication initiation ATPase DnaA
LTAADIIREEAHRAGVRPVDVRFRCRRRRETEVRRKVARRLRVELHLSYPKIGRALGGRDATTILWYLAPPAWHAEKKLRRLGAFR